MSVVKVVFTTPGSSDTEVLAAVQAANAATPSGVTPRAEPIRDPITNKIVAVNVHLPDATENDRSNAKNAINNNSGVSKASAFPASATEDMEGLGAEGTSVTELFSTKMFVSPIFSYATSKVSSSGDALNGNASLLIEDAILTPQLNFQHNSGMNFYRDYSSEYSQIRALNVEVTLKSDAAGEDLGDDFYSHGFACLPGVTSKTQMNLNGASIRRSSSQTNWILYTLEGAQTDTGISKTAQLTVKAEVNPFEQKYYANGTLIKTVNITPSTFQLIYQPNWFMNDVYLDGANKTQASLLIDDWNVTIIDGDPV